MITVDSLVASLRQLHQQFTSSTSFDPQVHAQLQAFQNSDNWAVCQRILSEPYSKENHGLMLFCAITCSAFVERSWTTQSHEAKEAMRTFLWQFVTERVSGQSVVPHNIFSTMVKVCTDYFISVIAF